MVNYYTDAFELLPNACAGIYFGEEMFDESRQRALSTSAERDDLVAAFLSVRRAIGFLGLSLPLLLYFQARVWPGGMMQPSISEFYHTVMGDVFVGTLIAIGVFLIAYVGHKPNRGDRLTDWWVSNIAGICAIGVAIFPTRIGGVKCSEFQPPTVIQGVVVHWCRSDWIHFMFAAVFFVCMALFCFFLFPKNAQGKITYFDKAGNTTYFFCGVALVIAILGLLIYFIMFDKEAEGMGKRLHTLNFVFWFETLGVVAFAIAWLTKGNFIGAAANFVAGPPAEGGDPGLPSSDGSSQGLKVQNGPDPD